MREAMSGHVAIVNAGGWGTALAVLLGSAGHEVRLWCRRAALAEEIEVLRENRAYLPGVSVPRTVRPTSSIEEVIEGAGAVILVPISRAARDTARLVAPHLGLATPVVHAAKGLELASLKRLSEAI